jgi:hypothetical protein
VEGIVIFSSFYQILSSPFDARNFSSGVKCGIQSYEIPPPPKPFQGKCSSLRYFQAPTRQQTSSPAPSPVANFSIEVLFHSAYMLQKTVFKLILYYKKWKFVS